MNKKIQKILLLEHRPIQLFLSTLWLLYGLLMLIEDVPILQYSHDILHVFPNRIQGAFLIFISLLGFWGFWTQNNKASLTFALFNVYKNFSVFIGVILENGISSSLWINDFVQFAASLLLVNKCLHILAFNIYLSKQKN